MSDLQEVPGFAPADPTDGREKLDWESKYPPKAQSLIRNEALYLAVHLFLAPILMLIAWLHYPQRALKLPNETYETILTYLLAWLGGLLGGTLYVIKWLYHVVARKYWHLDRRLWRLFTPHISGALAFAFITLISSGILRVFDRNAAQSKALVVAVAFLVGYFSDNAVAKLAEIAKTVFGASRGTEEHETKPTDNN